MRQKYFLIALSLILCACAKEDDKPRFIDLPVVTAYLKTGSSFSLNVSRQTPFDSTAIFSNDDINALQIKIIDEANNAVMLKAQGSGLYNLNDFIVQENKRYTLEFNYNNKVVSAETNVPSLPINITQSVKEISVPVLNSNVPLTSIPVFPDPILIKWSNADNSYYIIVIENIETSPLRINDDGNSPPEKLFRSQPIQASAYEISFFQFKYFGKHKLHLYHVNPEYAALYNTTNSTSQNLTEINSKLTNAKGIFTAMSASSIMINVKKQ